MDQHQSLPIFPGDAGLNTETSPFLLRDSEASDARNVELNEKSIQKSLGWRKLHQDRPRLAGVNFRPRPVGSVAAKLEAGRCPFAIIPYLEDQDSWAAPSAVNRDGYQIDVSFRFNNPSDVVLTGESQGGTNRVRERFGAPEGGEFQFQPLLSRGGSDVEELVWVLGVGVVGPGFDDGVVAVGLPTDDQEPRILRPIFAWWDPTITVSGGGVRPRMRFAVANVSLTAGIDYHLTLQLGSTTAESHWYLNGVALGQRGVVAATPPQTSEELGGFSPLPAASDLDRSYKFPLYVARPMTMPIGGGNPRQGVGVYPHARLFRGVSDLSILVPHATNLIFNIGDLQGRISGNVVGWSGYYARCKTGAGSNVGQIRKVASYDGVQTLTLSDALPAAIGIGDTFDLIPPFEPNNQDVTIQEVRIWRKLQTAATILLIQGEQALKDLRKGDPPENFAHRINADVADLVGYWHLSDDGGALLEDRSGFRNHGWFSSSPSHPQGQEQSLTLDGQRTALQYDLAGEQTFQRELQYNLGLNGSYRIHGRVSFQLCRDLVPRNCWRIDCAANGGTIGQTFTIDDRVNPPVVFTIVASGAVSPQVNQGTNAAELAANLKASIVAQQVALNLGVHIFPVDVVGGSLYLCTIDPVQLLLLSETGTSFTIESGIERSHYETIFDWDQPGADSPAPIFSLRWAHHNGDRKFFIVWNTGVEERYYEVDWTPDNETAHSIQPHIGVRYTLFFGIQTEQSSYHRLYVLVTDGSSEVRGWQELVTGIPIPTAADFRKSRISFGANVVAQTSESTFEGNPVRFGSGSHNAALIRVYEAGLGLRPFIKTPTGGGLSPILGTNPPPIDRWTSLDTLVPPSDIEPRISEAASLLTLTNGETRFSSTNGADWSSDVDGVPVPGYLLVLKATTIRRLRKNREAYFRPRYVHVAAFTSTGGPTTTGDLTEPWEGRNLIGTEARIVAYLLYVAFRHKRYEFPLNSQPDEGHVWATTEIYPDEGSLGSIGPVHWMVAILPTEPGVPQVLFTPTWGAGILRGSEPVLGLAQLKRVGALPRLVMVVKGSIYDVRMRWNADHPFPENESDPHSFALQVVPQDVADNLEELQDEILRLDRRTQPEPFEFWEIGNEPSGDPCRLWIPNNESFFAPASETYWRMLFWVKLDDLDGIRTICSRVSGLAISVTGIGGTWSDYRHQINHWFGLEDGALFLEIQNVTAGSEWSYRVQMAEDTKVRTRNLIPSGEWVQLGFSLKLNWGTSGIEEPIFFLNGKRMSQVVTKVTGAPTPQTIPPLPSEKGRIGAYGSDSAGTWLPIRYGLGGKLSRWAIDYSATAFPDFVPVYDLSGDYPNQFLSADMSEGFGIRAALSSLIPGLIPGEAVFRGRGAISLAHGFRCGAVLTSFAQYRDRLYGTNAASPLWEYDGETIVRAGLAPPSEEPILRHERREIRAVEEGASFPQDLTTGRCTLATASPHLTATVGWTPTESDIGKLVVVPSEEEFQTVGSSDGPDYIGVVSAIADAALGEIELTPVPAANQAGSNLAFMVFDAKTETSPPGITDYLDALGKISASTPYGLGRLVPCGTSPAAPPKQLDVSGVPIVEEQRLFDFRGNHAVEIQNLVSSGTEWPALGPDTVLDFKCYIRFEEIQTAGGAAQILFERRDDPDTASWEIAVIEQGKVRFRFWDEKLRDYREIKTVGRIFTTGEWYYFRFRYRFKRTGGSILDPDGGWEPDSRYEWRDLQAAARARHFRDGVWAWACEGRNPADPFLVLPGAHCGFDPEPTSDPTAQAKGHSRELGNTGYLAASPWMGPQQRDPNYSWPLATPENPVAMEAAFAAGAAGPDARTEFNVTFPGPLNFWPPRWWSINRDETHHQLAAGGKKQISQAAGNYYSDRANPARGSASTGTLHQATKARAVLCYVFGTAAGSPYGNPRILAVKHVGGNDLNPLAPGGFPRRGNEATVVPIRLTDDPLLGADGGGALPSGATNYVIAFALPNGSNHSSAATGNTEPLPTLLVQGEHPVGKDDRPVKGSDAVRIGGPSRPDLVRNGLLGLRAQVHDVGFSYYELDRTTNRVYTADHMLPDVDFHGPVDTRIGSLPALQFKDYQNASQVVDPSQDRSSRATWSARAGASSGFEVPSGSGEGIGTSGRLLQVDDRIQASGTHRVIVTFYDPERQVESPAGLEGFLEVEFDEDSETFVPAESKLIVKLPMSPDRRRQIWRRVYKTLPDGSIFLRTPDMEIRDNRTREVELAPSQLELEQGVKFDFGYQVPPLCRAILATEQQMIFAGLLEAPNVIAWSDAFHPENVPGTNRAILESGEGNPVTGLGLMQGQLYAFKRDSIFLIQVLGSAARVQRLQANTGAVSHHSIAEVEDNLVFLAEKGVYAFDGASRIYYLSPAIEGAFRGLDPLYLAQTSAAYSRLRNQYLFTARERKFGEARWVYTGEIPDSPVTEAQRLAWSRQYHPQGFTVLKSVDNPTTDDQVIVAGTFMGFAVVLDVDSGIRGYASAGPYKASREAIAGVTGSGQIILGGATVDQEEDALAGVPFLIVRTTLDGMDSPVSEGWLYKPSTALSLQVARPSDLVGVATGDVLHLGGWSGEWVSKWFDLSQFTRRKQYHYLDLVFAREVGGFFYLDVYLDFEGTSVITRKVPMDRGFCMEAISTNASFFQFRVRRFGNLSPLEIYAMSLRFEVETQREGQDA